MNAFELKFLKEPLARIEEEKEEIAAAKAIVPDATVTLGALGQRK